MRRRWIRKSAKWTCTIAAMLVAGAGVFCLFGTASFVYVSKGGVDHGIVEVGGGYLTVAASFGYEVLGGPIHEGLEIDTPVAWSWGMYDEAGSTRMSRGGISWHASSGPIGERWAGVTLLYPFLLTALPAGLLWWKDRHGFGPGRCRKCGYDRAGLTAATNCPECGTPPVPATV
jgi:hypothetical protein